MQEGAGIWILIPANNWYRCMALIISHGEYARVKANTVETFFIVQSEH